MHNPIIVDIREIDLTVPVDTARALFVLSPLERERERERDRYRLFAMSKLKEYFLILHFAVRDILAEYLKIPAATIEFIAGPKGKPAIKDSSWQFNLSHSDGKAFLAVGPILTAYTAKDIVIDQEYCGAIVIAAEQANIRKQNYSLNI